MSLSPDDTRPPTRDRVPRRFWVGVAALVVYILFAAVLGNITGAFAPDGDVTAEFALSPSHPAADRDRSRTVVRPVGGLVA